MTDYLSNVDPGDETPRERQPDLYTWCDACKIERVPFYPLADKHLCAECVAETLL